MSLYLIGAGVGLLAALLLTPTITPLACRLGAIDCPNHRTIHQVPTPRLGGVAIFGALCLSVGILLAASPEIRDWILADLVKAAGLLVGLTIVFVLGVFDDFRSLNEYVKFPVQILAATIVYAVGFRADAVGVPWDGAVSLGVLTYPVTILWVVGITNAINLIDGLDGLAAGVSAIASTTICLIALSLGHAPVALLTAVLSGVLVGFLFFNFHPAKLFMGDSGSLVLGFSLATVALQGVQKGSTAFALLVPIVVMAVPIADTLTAIVRRLATGRWPFAADREHFHHRLLWKGLNQTRAVLCLYAVSAACGVAAYVMAVGTPGVSWAVVLTVAVGGILLIRQLDYAEFNGIVGRILNGDRRRRPPRYKNLVMKKVGSRISSAGNFDRVWRSMTMAAKELEFDMLDLKPSPPSVHGSQAVSWRRWKRSAAAPRPDSVLWTQDHSVGDNGAAVSLTIGKFGWKNHRYNEDEERWGRELAAAFAKWWSVHGQRSAGLPAPSLEFETEILPPIVVSNGSAETRHPSPSQ
jgi:UDP-GlcNAc:undecaprenyl-phosphate GlcNAc-1-phosphate transferase